jgi:hypothetical protein
MTCLTRRLFLVLVPVPRSRSPISLSCHLARSSCGKNHRFAAARQGDIDGGIMVSVQALWIWLTMPVVPSMKARR